MQRPTLLALTTGIAGVALLGAASACSDRTPADAQTEPRYVDACTPKDCTLENQDVARFAAGFLGDPAFRRVALVHSLLITNNTYAQERLLNYAQPDGWDSLPVYNPPTSPLFTNNEGRLTSLEYTSVFDHETADDSTTWSVDEWASLGKRAFHNYPAQQAAAFQHELSLGEVVAPIRAERNGLWRTTAGALGGLVSVQYDDGSVGVALTCATCHAQTNTGGVVVDGVPSNINLTAFSDGADWGPGKVDVTPDALDNPVAIADLRATRVQRRLHYSGNLENSLVALAVRIESLLITNTQAAVRPPREIAFSLAVYIWRLGEQLAYNSPGRSASTETHAAGAGIFDRQCSMCHQGEWGEGEWVAADTVGTDPLVARSPARGTGGYRVSALLGFEGRKLSHEGRVEGLETWLIGDRSNTGLGSQGHAQATGGKALTTAEVQALSEFLRAAF